MYETPSLLSQYLLFHFGSDAENLPWEGGPRGALGFPRRCVHEGLDTARLSASSTALDIGCAVGGTTFELARHCGQVIGVDYSTSFITAANRLRESGSLDYIVSDIGEQTHPARACVDPAIDRSRVRFEQGDAQALRADLGAFDAVLCCNLLCRLQAPMKLLLRLHELVLPGGQLLITTPETWLAEHTPSEHWISGRPGQAPLLDTLAAVLSPHFSLERTWQMPFLIREHRRKYQWTVAEASRWKRED
jgi:putative 4-mercaptohistidine N1-methyltranferase